MKTVDGVSRRNFLKGAAIAGAGVFGAGMLAGCTSGQHTETAATGAESEQSTAYSLMPGVYQSTVEGKVGPMVVTTVVSEDRLVKVDAGGIESKQFGVLAINTMADEMVRKQFVDVDTCTGATVTSLALIQGVRDCLKQAGDESAFSQAPITESHDEHLSCDIVVMGSGISGQAAALSAAEAGAKVIMVEKLGIPGGAATGSGGAILAAGSSLQNEADGNMDPQGLIDHLYRYSEEQATYDVIKNTVEHSAEIIDWYTSLGVKFQVGECYGTPIHYSHRAWNPDGEEIPHPAGGAIPHPSSGSNIFDRTYPAFLAAGGICLLNTKVTELLQDDSGTVTGVVAMRGGDTITIDAKAVVLAAGGCEGSAEALAKWFPHTNEGMVGGSTGLCNVHDTGDGIELGLAAGGYLTGGGYGQTTGMYSPIPAIKVTMDGVRDSDEMHSELNEDQGSQFKAFYDSGTEYAWTLYGANTQDEAALKALESAQEKGVVFEGKTLAEVAEAAGVDAAGLEKTVERFNEMVAAGKDDDFGTADIAAYGTYEEGPYYLVRYSPGINGTIGGLKISMDSEVLREDGTKIDGLYAGGETCNGEYMYRLYPSGGASLLWGSVSGRLAGQAAAKYVSA
ncbi:FAD-dependent oxidoreductase [Eggerthellaceae bacterium 3-80]|nr:FAD-dependent oxidoreductase [bacterium D16-34]